MLLRQQLESGSKEERCSAVRISIEGLSSQDGINTILREQSCGKPFGIS